MKKVVCLLFFMALFASCAVKRTYVRDYAQQIQLVKDNFPEIYDMYRQGTVIIVNVYTYEKDGKARVGITYHYR